MKNVPDDTVPSIPQITVARCEEHNVNYLCIDRPDDIGIRLTKKKCCGRYTTIYSFDLTEDLIDNIEQVLEDIRSEYYPDNFQYPTGR